MKKGPVKFIILILIIFIVCKMAGMLAPDIKTQVVATGSLEKLYSLDGQVCLKPRLKKARLLRKINL